MGVMSDHMSDDKPRMPARIRAGTNLKLTRYMVPSGKGVTEHPQGMLYLRADVDPLLDNLEAERDAECERAEKAEAERDALRQAAHFVQGLPPGEWETWDSCSFRRISSREGSDGDVLHAIVQRADGHPDLSWNAETCWALCHLVNGLRAALRQDEGDK